MSQKQNPPADELKTKLLNIARCFTEKAGEAKVELLGQGYINTTYRLHCSSGSFILQKINSTVFPEPRRVADNSAYVARYLKRYYGDLGLKTPAILQTKEGASHIEFEGEIWRAQDFIENSFTRDRVENAEMAYEAGGCLALFHNAVAELPPQSLHETLPGFHFLPGYLQIFDNRLKRARKTETKEFVYCLAMAEKYRSNANYLETAWKSGLVAPRVIHGDPKVSNILFSRESAKGLTLIDLDTVGSGLLLYDIGDFLRSICCRSGEGAHLDATLCEIELVEAALKGYLHKGTLNQYEKESVYESLLLLTYELGLRFLSDFLNGNQYFKVGYAEENLHRAIKQFKLVESIDGQQHKIRNIVHGLQKKT